MAKCEIIFLDRICNIYMFPYVFLNKYPTRMFAKNKNKNTSQLIIFNIMRNIVFFFCQVNS